MRTYPLTEEKRQKWLDEGRGKGEGPDYKPWLTYYDFASKGNMHRLLEGRHRRLCHLFSDVEHRIFLYLDASRCVQEIYEQYPLELATTRVIASNLGIRHPRDPRSGIDLTMTTDFLVKTKWRGESRLIAFSCKLDSDLGDFNNAEHAEIERQYWLQHGVSWHFVTDGAQCVPEQLFENLLLLYPRRFLAEEVHSGPVSFQERTEILMREIQRCTQSKSLHQLSLDLSATYGLANDKWLQHAYHLIYRHQLITDLIHRNLGTHDIEDIAHLTFCSTAKEAA